MHGLICNGSWRMLCDTLPSMWTERWAINTIWGSLRRGSFCCVQGRARLPVTLVLAMAISVAALRHMLPAKAADVLQPKEFRLVQVFHDA